MKFQRSIFSLIVGLGLATQLMAAPKSITIRVESSPKANVQGRQAVPLPISVFLLSGSARFDKATYYSLEESSRRTLGGEYLTKRSLILLPKQRKTITLPNNSEARYIGFIGGYSSLKGKRWRRLVSLSTLDDKDLIARYNNTGVVFRYNKKVIKDRQGLYVDGNLAYNLISASSDRFEFTQDNPASLEIGKLSSFGQLGMGVGYEWQRGENNWVNSLHLEKVSLGVGIYFIPQIKIEGHVAQKTNLNRAYTIKTSAELLMLEAKINFLRFGNFTSFVDTGFGSTRYQNTYERDASSGAQLSTQNDNSAMTYKAGFGLEYDLNNKLSLSFGYDYYSPTKLEVKEIASGGGDSHSNPELTINNSAVFFKVHYFFEDL